MQHKSTQATGLHGESTILQTSRLSAEFRGALPTGLELLNVMPVAVVLCEAPQGAICWQNRVADLWLRSDAVRFEGVEAAAKEAIGSGAPLSDRELASGGVRADIELVRCPGGGVAGAICVLREVSPALRRAEHQLAELEEVYDSAPAGLLLVSRDLRYLRLNERMAAINGVPVREHLGRTIEEVVPGVAQTAVANYRRVIDTGEPVIRATVSGRTRAHGEERQFVTSYHPVKDASGIVVAVTAVVEDVTEAKRAEEALLASEELTRGILESSVDCILVLGANGSVETIGAGGLRALQIPESECYRGREWLGFWKEPDRAAASQAMEEARRGGVGRFEGRVEGFTETPRYWSVTVTPIAPATGGERRLLCIARDVTEMREARDRLTQLNQELTRQVAKFELLLETMPVAIRVAHDADCKKITENEYNRRLGIPLASNGGGAEECVVISHGVPLPLEEMPLRRAVRSGRPVRDEELTVIGMDGSTRTIYGHAVPLLDEGGGVQGGFAAFVDITERKKTEAKLSETEQRHGHVLRAINDAIWEWNPANGHVVWSESAGDLFGGTPGTSPASLWSADCIAAEDRGRVRAGLEAAIGGTGESWAAKYWIRRSDDSWAYVLNRGYFVRDEEGTVVQAFGSISDLTTLRQAEEALQESEGRFRAIVDQSTAGIAQMELDGRLLLVNDRFCSLVGRSREELLRMRMQEIGPPSSPFPPDESYGQEACYMRPDGTPVWVTSNLSLVRNARGEAQSIVAVLADTTEQRRALEAHRAIERQLLLLTEAARTLLVTPRSSAVLPTVLELAQQFIKADAYVVWRQRPAVWQRTASMGLSESCPEYLPGEDLEKCSGELIAVEDIDQTSYLRNHRELLKAEGIRSALVVPLVIHGEASRSLGFYWRSPHLLTEVEMRIAEALGNLAASALATAELYDRQSALRSKAQGAERRAEFLAEAGAVLSSSLHYERNLAVAGVLSVPAFADWCAVDLCDEQGSMQRVAAVHFDPTRTEFVYEYRDRYPQGAGDPLAEPKRTGKPLLIEELTEAELAERVRDPGAFGLLQTVGVRSLLAVPMMMNGACRGMLTFAAGDSRRRYTQLDLQMAEELARRGVAAMENARLYRDVRESEERFRQLAENIREVFYMFDRRENRMVYVSPGYEQIWGRPPGSDRGGNFRSFLDGVHPDDAARVRAGFLRQEAGIATEEEYRVVRPDGSLRWVWDRAFPIRDSDGAVYRVAGIAEDVTERKQALEERFALLEREKEARRTAELLNRVGPVLASELDTRRLAQDITDIGRQLTGAEFGALFQYDGEKEAFQLYTVSGASPETAEARMGPDMWNAGSRAGTGEVTVPLVARSGQVLGGLLFSPGETGHFTAQQESLMIGLAAQAAIALDNSQLFTAAQAAQESLQRSNEELRRANFDLEQFAYSASHDLQEPMRMVATYSQMLEYRYRGKLDERADEYIRYAVQGAKRMQELVRDLLVYTQAASITAAEPHFSASAKEAYERALEALNLRIEQANATITADELPQVGVNCIHLQQVLQNLIANALKYRKAEELPRIHVSARREGEAWLFSVADNGIGIDPRYAEEIFGIFRRLHRGETYSGTGIGLAICQKIVERYGGRIWVESRGEGYGSTFFFTVPGGDNQQ